MKYGKDKAALAILIVHQVKKMNQSQPLFY